MENQTFYFHLVTFSKNIEEQSFFFVMFFLIYIICIIWNVAIFVVIFLDEHLHAPMYFFLRNLSLVDIFYTTATLPKLLDIILTGDNRISYLACFSQLYFLIFLGSTEVFLLTAMSYDRYVAICHPLHYVFLMGRRRCLQLVISCWIIGSSNAFLVTYFASTLNFCRSRDINHTVCDAKILTELSCGNKKKFEMMIYLDTIAFGLFPFSLIIISYSKIISVIVKIRSTGQRHKTFSTCTSHLIVLLLFYGSLFCMYMRPAMESSEKLDVIFSVLYLAVTPILNPLIYSLRNKDIKDAIRKKIKMGNVKVARTCKTQHCFKVVM